jgi:hypothetical protein
MKTSAVMTEEKLVRKAVQFLIERFGPVETQRFLSLSPSKREESVKRHRNWQMKLDKKKFLAKAIRSK